MSGPSILIAAYSGRALAQSARRAGFAPLVVDAYGDLDTRSAAAGLRTLPEVVAQGFRSKPLLAALDALSAAAASRPAGLVLGSGFEDVPGLIATLEKHFTLLGCGAETNRRCKDPTQFFPLLEELGIPHPSTRTTAPADPTGWLSKRIGGCGGTHIRACAPGAAADAGRYVQQHREGLPISASVVCGRRDVAVAWGYQWTAPTATAPFRYGGAAGSITLDPELEGRLMDIVLQLIPKLGLVGLVSFDFLLTPDGDALLLEVNPRPGATLDIFDDAAGTLFRAHVAAGRDDGSVAPVMQDWAPEFAASAYCYADKGALVAGDHAWPEWSSDRPPAGAVIPAMAPIATVKAVGAMPEDAETSCRERVRELTRLLYETTSGKERQSCHAH
ncbi:MAG: ATP-grasp domain-containing protein [Hyphomicrobium sp.]